MLPFTNMRTDPEGEFFADGITEEIINALAQIEQLRVAARTSAFSFKGKHIDLRIIPLRRSRPGRETARRALPASLQPIDSTMESILFEMVVSPSGGSPKGCRRARRLA